jgi:hypothetical protein
MVKGAVPLVLSEVKEATGGDTLLTVMKSFLVTVSFPAELLAVRDTE